MAYDVIKVENIELGISRVLKNYKTLVTRYVTLILPQYQYTAQIDMFTVVLSDLHS